MQWNRLRNAVQWALAVLVIFVFVRSAWASPKERVLHSFDCATDGCGSYAALTLDAKGNLYGTTLDSVFKMTHGQSGWTLKVLHLFNVLSEGESLNANVAFDPAGNLYSTAQNGGTYDFGTVFELIPGSAGWTLNVLHSFNLYGGDGGDPFAGVVLDKAGNLYGTTQDETAYELTPSSGGAWAETIIDDFKGKGDGSQPEAGLVWDAVGNLYGTTRFGGLITQGCSGGCGTIFELSPTSGGGWKERVLHRFNWVPGSHEGQAPYAGLVFDGSGDLYGTTAGGGSDNTCGGGCGTVFKLTPLARGRWKETILHNFNSGKNGNAPFAGLVLDKAGNLYGTTQRGGIGSSCQGGCGVVFKLAHAPKGKWVYSVVHRFTGPDGAVPNAGLIFDKPGKHLYGTTTFGGTNGVGTVFEITP